MQEMKYRELIKGQITFKHLKAEKAKSICQQLFHVLSIHATNCRYHKQRDHSNELKTVRKPFVWEEFELLSQQRTYKINEFFEKIT